MGVADRGHRCRSRAEVGHEPRRKEPFYLLSGAGCRYHLGEDHERVIVFSQSGNQRPDSPRLRDTQGGSARENTNVEPVFADVDADKKMAVFRYLAHGPCLVSAGSGGNRRIFSVPRARLRWSV
jgi:hypothetical protein